MTETKTATLLGVGPFNGWFTEHSFLFELYPPLETDGHSLVHVVTSSLAGYDRFPGETLVFATLMDGSLDYAHYAEAGPILELTDVVHPAQTMHRLGYTTVIMDATARV
jgi:hypothetical protein